MERIIIQGDTCGAAFNFIFFYFFIFDTVFISRHDIQDLTSESICWLKKSNFNPEFEWFHTISISNICGSMDAVLLEFNNSG